MVGRIPWSDLPKELVEKIAKHLDTETDVTRFRAICRSWRYSTPPFIKFPRRPLKLPYPFSHATETSHYHAKNHDAYFLLTQRTVYRFQSVDDSNDPKFWIVKVERSDDGKLRVLNPVSDHPIKNIHPIPKVLNTLGFRVYEVCKCYTLRYVNPNLKHGNDHDYDYTHVKKVVVSVDYDKGEYVVMAIDHEKKLWYIRSGDEKWTIACRRDYSKFLDVVSFKGRFYAIDLWGGTWTFDSETFEGRNFTYNRHGASKRHLLELGKELLLIEGVTDKDAKVCTCYDYEDGCHCGYARTRFKNTSVEVKVLKMDKLETEWEEVKTLDDVGRIIFVGDDCSFSVSSEEFEGCKGITRVFYTDQYIFFRTEGEKKVNCCEEYGYGDYDYNYFECDCGCTSSDDEAVVLDKFVPSEDVKLKFRELHGHNTGVCDFKTGKIGSLLLFPEFADIFWPPPSWLVAN